MKALIFLVATLATVASQAKTIELSPKELPKLKDLVEQAQTPTKFVSKPGIYGIDKPIIAQDKSNLTFFGGDGVLFVSVNEYHNKPPNVEIYLERCSTVYRSGEIERPNGQWR